MTFPPVVEIYLMVIFVAGVFVVSLLLSLVLPKKRS